jgi:hypothetical protein
MSRGLGGRRATSLHIGLLHTDGTNGETLELTTRKEGNVTVIDVAQLQSVEHLVQVAHRDAAFNQGLDALVSGTDSLGNLVDVLRLDDGLEVILEQLGEVV